MSQPFGSDSPRMYSSPEFRHKLDRDSTSRAGVPFTGRKGVSLEHRSSFFIKDAHGSVATLDAKMHET